MNAMPETNAMAATMHTITIHTVRLGLWSLPPLPLLPPEVELPPAALPKA